MRIPIEFLDGRLTAGMDGNGAALHEAASPSRTAGRPVLLSPGATPGVRQCLPLFQYCPAAKGTRRHFLLGLLIGFNQRLARFFVDAWEFWRSVLSGDLRRNTRGGRLGWLLQVNGGLQ